LPLNFFNATRSTQPIYINNEKDNTISAILAPKSNSYAITEKWNYTGSDLNDIVISLDGNYIALSQNNKFNLTLFNKNSNDTLWTTDKFDDYVNSFDISADGKYISVGDHEKWVYLFNNTEVTPAWSKTSMWKYDTDTDNEVVVAISGDGKYTAAYERANLYLLDNTLKSEKWTYTTPGPLIGAVDIGYDPIGDRYYIAIGDDAGNVTLFDDISNVPLWSNDTTSLIDTLKISDDGSHILAKNSNNEIYLFDNAVQTPKLALWKYITSDIVDIDISAECKKIIVCKETKIHYLNNTPSVAKTTEWEGTATTHYLVEGRISGDGRYVLAGGYEGTVSQYGWARLYNSTKTTPKIRDWEITKGSNIPKVAINGFGNYFAIVSSGTLHFYHHDVPLPRAITARSGGGGDDDEEAAAIPFGNFYLVFACVSIISLIVIIKKKAMVKLK